MSSDLVKQLRRDHTAWLNECRLPPEERSSYSDAADRIASDAILIERLRAVVQMAVTLRERQKVYFKSRDRGDLIASKEAEAAFDKAAKP